MKNEPAQKLEINDFSLAVGRRPLTLRRAFGTTRWRPVVKPTSTAYSAEEVIPERWSTLVPAGQPETSARRHTQKFGALRSTAGQWRRVVEQRNGIRRSSSAKPATSMPCCHAKFTVAN